MTALEGNSPQAFLERNGLESSYLRQAGLWFDPLATRLAIRQQRSGRPLLVAVNGCQGSGKTTLCDYIIMRLQLTHGLNGVALSLDDFYLTRAQRAGLAASIHPLLETRGVPGTHDLTLLHHTLDTLLQGTADPVEIPRFDKARDDRRPKSSWDRVAQPIDIVLLEGWCIGAAVQNEEELVVPLNGLERESDADGSWRRYVNACVRDSYTSLFDRSDLSVMLCAPSWETVYKWRLEQEQKLAARVHRTSGPDRIMNASEIKTFVEHFERITHVCLQKLPAKVDYLYRLNQLRSVIAYSARGENAN